MRWLLIFLFVAMPVMTSHADDPPAPVPQPPDPEPVPQPPDETPKQTPKETPVETPIKPSAETPQTSDSVASAPKPEQAPAQLRGESHAGEWVLWIPRVLLFPIRAVVYLVGWPISKGLYALELYNLTAEIKALFFNEDGTVAIFPVAFVETGFGLNIGGRLIVRRIAGTDTGFTGRASFGGRFRQLFTTKLSTNKTFKHLAFDLRSSYESRPKDLFFGIGNGGLVEGLPPMPVDARSDELRESRFRQDAFRASAQATYRPTKQLQIGLSGALLYRKFFAADDDDGGDRQLTDTFDVTTVNRFVEGSNTAYAELEVTYDARQTPSRFESLAMPSAGWLLGGFAGYTRGFNGDPSRYIRYGLDLQNFLRLAEGPRALALRLKIEGVTGGYGEVSFYDLPKLGGPLLLRGYNLDQYRDRVAGLGTLEYQFDTSENSSGFVFADVGRVYAQPEDITLSDMRLGFGGGIQFHSKKNFLGRFTIASSPQKDIFLSLSFDPVYDTRARVERR